MSAVPEITNLIIEKGTDFEVSINLFNDDSSVAILSGLSTTYARIAKHPSSTRYQNFNISITAGSGLIKLSLDSTKTSQLEVGRNYFDVILTVASKKTKVIGGTAIVVESISV